MPIPRKKPQVFHRQKGVRYQNLVIRLPAEDAALVKAAASRSEKSEQLILQELVSPGLQRLKQQVS